MWTSPNSKKTDIRRDSSIAHQRTPVQWLGRRPAQRPERTPVQWAERRHAQRLAAVAALVALGATGTAALAARVPATLSARALNVTDEAHLHVTHSSGSLLQEEGTATGALPGTVRVSFRVAASISGSFTIYPRGGGSISGTGSARLHSGGSYASFSGSISVNHGTGRYARAHGAGGFYGTVDRRNNALVIQTTGRLSY
jgi:hypothetical protein